jgi:hypothetical protein
VLHSIEIVGTIHLKLLCHIPVDSNVHVTFTAEAAVNKLLLLKQQYVPLQLMWLIITSIGIVGLTSSSGSSSTVICHLMTGIHFGKCVVRHFRCCANIIECTYTNLDSIV